MPTLSLASDVLSTDCQESDSRAEEWRISDTISP
jgi:hypothetical protein